LAELIDNVAKYLEIKPESILSGSRKKPISDARAIIAFYAVSEIGHSASDVARALRISRVSVRQCVERGQKLSDKKHDLGERLLVN